MRACRRRRDWRADRHQRGRYLRRAIALEAVRAGPAGCLREPGEAVQNAKSILSRLPSSDEPCWLVAGDEVEEPIGASQRLPTTAVRPRAQGWKASFLAFLASVQTSQSIRQARSDPNFCSPHGRASRRSVVMVGVGARRPTRLRWASCGACSDQTLSELRRTSLRKRR